MDLISEDLTIHPTLLCDILAEQMFNIFKTARVFLFGHKKHGKLFSCSTYCHHFGYSYFALLPSKALFPFELMGFIRETLVEEAKSSALDISSNFSFERVVSFQELVISSVTDLHSSPITFREM